MYTIKFSKQLFTKYQVFITLSAASELQHCWPHSAVKIAAFERDDPESIRDVNSRRLISTPLWPCALRLKVGRDCGLLPLALAIAGSMAVVKGRGHSGQAWLELHNDLESRVKKLMAKGGTRTSIHHVCAGL